MSKKGKKSSKRSTSQFNKTKIRLIAIMLIFGALGVFTYVSSTLAAPVVQDITLQLDPDRSGLGARTITWGDNLIFDKNNDGIMDILLSYHLSKGWEIWLGTQDGKYVFDQSLPKDDRHNCKAADFGAPGGGDSPDGMVDLVCVIGAGIGTSNDKANELFIQKEDGTFVNEAISRGFIDKSGRGRVVEVLDIRKDGLPNLFVGNRKTREHPSLDRIFERTGANYRNVQTAGLPSNQDSTCSVTGDFNKDSRQDFLTCSFKARLYRNDTATSGAVVYRNVAVQNKIPQLKYNDMELVDLNNDGWLDLVAVRSNRVEVRLNMKKVPHFSKVHYQLTSQNANSVCYGKANSDGFLDLLVVQGTTPKKKLQSPDRMLINNGTGRGYKLVTVPQPPTSDGRNGNGDTCSTLPNHFGERSAWVINNGKPNHEIPASKRHGYRQVVLMRNQ